MVTTAMARLFWGFLFTMVDFRINRFDIFIDVVGYLLVVLACNTLKGFSRRFGVSFTIAIPMLVLSVLELFRFGGVDLSIAGTRPVDPTGSVVAATVGFLIVMFFLDLVMVYNICAGIWEMAEERGRRELASEAHSRWILYLAMAITGTLLLAITVWAWSIDSPGIGDFVGVFLLFFIFVIIVTVLFLIMLRHAQNQIGGHAA